MQKLKYSSPLASGTAYKSATLAIFIIMLIIMTQVTGCSSTGDSDE
jgi:TRAP-type mannitol/chloroaromatic compound transport system permease large subunit